MWLLSKNVTHQAFIETNEEGTEAAAANMVEMGVTSAGQNEQLFIDINRPFIFIISETTSNPVLFIGKVSDPLAN
jgi:serine protease inhibitor